MMRILSTCIKLIDILLQEITFHLELGPKNVNFFFREPNLLRLISRIFRYQLLITPNRPVASKKKTLSYWLAITTASTAVDCLFVLNGLKSIVAPILSNYKASGKVDMYLIIDE